MVDKASEPLGFLDDSLRAGFLAGFAHGGIYRGGAEVEAARFDGFSQVEVSLAGGDKLAANIVLAAFGRIANLDGIGLERLKLRVSKRGHVEVNERFETSVAGYMPQATRSPSGARVRCSGSGRRAALAAFDLAPSTATSLVPTGVYTIPRSPASACRRHRRQPSISTWWWAAPTSAKWRGRTSWARRPDFSSWCASAFGTRARHSGDREGATDLVHLARPRSRPARRGVLRRADLQLSDHDEAYRVAAFDVLKQRVSKSPRRRSLRARGG